MTDAEEGRASCSEDGGASKRMEKEELGWLRKGVGKGEGQAAVLKGIAWGELAWWGRSRRKKVATGGDAEGGGVSERYDARLGFTLLYRMSPAGPLTACDVMNRRYKQLVVVVLF